MSLVPLYWGVPAILVYLAAAAYKPEWIRYALAVSACLFAIAWSQVGKASGAATEVGTSAVPSRATPADRIGVLDAANYQDFPLTKKTVISSTQNPKSGIKAITSIYRFSLPKPTDQLGLPIGQHISLAYTIQDEGKDKLVARSYTPISSDNDRGYVDLLIKAYYPVGNLSKHVDQLKIGDTIKIRGPKGAMKYHSGLVKRFGMIAGGTGLTPMLQIIQAIRRGRPKDTTEVDLIYANQTAEDILLKEELDTIAKEDPKIRIHYVLEVTPEGWTGGKGFVTADMMKEKLPAPADDVKILLCGPPPMITAMKKNTESLGFAKARAVSKLEDQVFCF